MTSLERKRQLRTQFMQWLYDQADGDESAFVAESEFVAVAELSRDELASMLRYLQGEGLVRDDGGWLGTLPGGVRIAHRGVVEVELGLSRPDQPTEHFVPAVHVTNVTTVHGDVVGSQLQQGSPGAIQQGEFTTDARRQVAEFSRAVREALPDLGLDERTRDRTSRDLDALDAELDEPQPRKGFLRELTRSVRAVAEEATGGVAAAGLLSLPTPF